MLRTLDGSKDLSAFFPFAQAESKGRGFRILYLQSENHRYWHFAILSEGEANFAKGYVTDGVLRVCATIANPAGYLLFRCDMVAGLPNPHQNFQCKFGATAKP